MERCLAFCEELTIVQKSGDARVDGRVLGVQTVKDDLVKQQSLH